MTYKDRKNYFDGLKYISIFIIYFSHFIVFFHPEYVKLWIEPPFSFLIRGITGKYSVAILGVCLAYFAYGSKEINASVYFLRRYFYFLASGLLINTIIAVLTKLLPYDQLYNSGLSGLAGMSTTSMVWEVLRESLLLGRNIYPTFWCMSSFFGASVFAYLAGRAEVKTVGIVVGILWFWLSGQVWVAICLLGCIYKIIADNTELKRLLSYWPVRIIWSAFALLIIRRNESVFTYLLDGISAVMILGVVDNSPVLQKVLSAKFLSWGGKNVMGIFLVHVPVYVCLGTWLFRITSFLSYSVSFCLSLIVCWGVSTFLAYPVSAFIGILQRQFTGMIKNRILLNLNGTTIF